MCVATLGLLIAVSVTLHVAVVTHTAISSASCFYAYTSVYASANTVTVFPMSAILSLRLEPLLSV